jgi:hypothetical protein
MSHTLTLDLPNEVYEPLSRKARQDGRKPEDVATEWLTAAVQRETADPLLQLAGTLEADVTDIGERHDHYIGEALAGELRGRGHG